jgi:predicted TIM-barrel fold metal-dependent hydrolase
MRLARAHAAFEGEWMVIDWEHHFLPEELMLRKGGKKGEHTIVYEHGRARGNLRPELADVETHLSVMDAAGIDLAVLSIAVSSDEPRAALEECRIWNDAAAEVVRRYPGRFVALAPIPPLGGEAAFDELKRAVETLGSKGVVVRSQAGGLSMDNKDLYPFYERVAKLGVPIFIHPSGVQQGMSILDAPYDLGRSIGRELDLIVATTRLILSGVLDDFSELRFVISHKGGGIAAVRERIEYQFGRTGAPGTRPGGSRNRRPFDQCLASLYFNLAGSHGGMGSVRCALTAISPKRLVFGTDYPQEFSGDSENIKAYIEDIGKLEIDEEGRAAMLGENARQLLGL